MAAAAWPALTSALGSLDARIAREIARLRARYQLSLDEFRGLYISDEQVDRLVAEMRATGVADADEPAASVGRCGCDGDASPLTIVAGALGLDRLERDLVLIAAAPELDLKYETLYAYLNDDVTRKWPTIDLAERLLSEGPVSALDVRNAFRADRRLAALGVVHRIDAPGLRPSSLNTGFGIAGAVVHRLLGMDGLGPELTACCSLERAAVGWEDVPVTARRLATLRRVPDLIGCRRELPLFMFTGEAGAGQDTAAAAIAAALGLPILACDVLAARAAGVSLGPLGIALSLQLRLRPSVLLLTGIDDLMDDRGEGELRRLLRHVRESGAPIFITGPHDAAWYRLGRGMPALAVEFETAAFGDRAQLWDRAATAAGVPLQDGQPAELASRFQLAPRDMAAAIASARDLAVLDGRSAGDAGAYLTEAAHRLVSHELGSLGTNIRTTCTWDAIVLPESTLSRLHALSAAIRSRHRVFDAWGFGERTTTGVGIRALFAGPSGTGKTMTASVIANELGLDLYRIDLSSVVSKYIGETEKNLDRIFRAARSGHVMLFFDEADALFGKRSEVKDAHDRYANIEVAFLLQRLEDHTGAVVLATNLKRNIDDAFARRMQFVIEFSPPQEAHRERLWRTMFPAAAPLAADLDFPFLAGQFELAGGDIRNVVLDAAFQAAESGSAIAMPHVVRALARQLGKEGKLPSPALFRQYYAFLT